MGQPERLEKFAVHSRYIKGGPSDRCQGSVMHHLLVGKFQGNHSVRWFLYKRQSKCTLSDYFGEP